MSLLTYNFLHLIGVILLFLGIGATLATANGTVKNKLAGIAHGVGLLLLLVAGFGLIAKLHIGFPVWVITKLVIWLAFGALPVLIKRKVLTGATAWTVAIALGCAAAYLGIFKPQSDLAPTPGPDPAVSESITVPEEAPATR